MRRTVLISEPQAIDYPAPILPYMWAVLKSHWERRGDGGSAYLWLDPIFMNADPDTLLRPCDDVTIDVVGLSCYTWNWSLQCAIAKRIKARHPHCLVVAGGPDPDYKDPEFFRRHPYIDMVAVKDGEITFNKLLGKVSRDEADWGEIGGLCLPGVDGQGHRFTGPAEVPTVFDYSPYLDQAPFYERLMKGHRPGAFHATWETNRGCPYSCTFCDWGSNTMSKVRRFDMERLEAEIDWLGRMKIGNVYCADANFGILPRDLSLADRLNAAYRRYGYPRQVNYSAAKNDPERVVAIALKFVETGICPNHMFAIQHTRPEVLAATDRSNISTDKQVKVVKSLMSSGVPITVQLILGIPGDTLDLWKGCLTDLMELGVHEDYDTYFYSVLPNAPAADKRFLEHWEVETIDRFIFTGTTPAWKPTELDVRSNRSHLVVKTKTFSRQDWLKMFTFTVLVKALHNASVTRLIAMYLRLTHHVPYLTFYEGLIEDFFAKNPLTRCWYETVLECYQNFLEHEDARDRITVAALPSFPYALEPSRWVDVQVCRDLDRFFEALSPHLLGRFPDVRNLASVIDYQREIIIVPTYDRRRGKTFVTDYNWPRYFSEAAGRTGSESLDEPEFICGAVVEVSDQTCGEKGFLVRPLEWGAGGDEERWIAWIDAVRQRNSAAKRNFQLLRVRAQDPAYSRVR